MTLTFLTMPVSTNQLYRVAGSRMYMSERGKRYKETFGWEARSQYRGKPIEGKVAVEISLFWKDNRNHDIENLKATFDALNGILWNDDGQIHDLHIMKGVDRKNPRVEMTIQPITT